MPKPTGPQFISVFHSSMHPTPPHRMPATDSQEYHPDDNMHPNIIHMGTRESAQDWNMRTNIHEYRINLRHPSVSSITFGESPNILKMDHDIDDEVAEISALKGDINEAMGGEAGELYAKFQKSMPGKQPGLFEETAPDTLGIAEKGIVTPYRNRREDVGSISWMVPKSQIGDEGAVQYVKRRKRK